MSWLLPRRWSLGFRYRRITLHQIANEVGEQSIISRAGDAPTGGRDGLHFTWRVGRHDGSCCSGMHFAILFEALFILTAVDADCRAARFMLQDLLGVVSPGLETYRFAASELLCYGIVRAGVGVFPPSGEVVDPLGGINTLWPLFGIANQMLAGMALMLCAVVLFKK